MYSLKEVLIDVQEELLKIEHSKGEYEPTKNIFGWRNEGGTVGNFVIKDNHIVSNTIIASKLVTLVYGKDFFMKTLDVLTLSNAISEKLAEQT